MRKITIRIQKINAGVLFTPEITGSGPAPVLVCDTCGDRRVQPKAHRNGVRWCRAEGYSPAPGSPLAAAFGAAHEWYEASVWEALEKAGLQGTDYARRFREALPRYVASKADGAFYRELELEPWGFALTDGEGSPVMAGGSFPTECRARILLCHQAPLEEVRACGQVSFLRLFDPENPPQGPTCEACGELVHLYGCPKPPDVSREAWQRMDAKARALACQARRAGSEGGGP